ncbi:monovalent cation/H+ antiporter complex subunit F [Sphingomonas sp. S1-29]|uniref:monovalent cation/H+ antiporter complex subunit F n=1 Tax=Sphingomonas sp. S1-29 TaxID=2991074 RepID=UPI00223EEDA7|nr:monovalent cation/H+ antiporter complex subunit F [Sphingomonas sp. S1-29]UZK68834.1 monovalent cation/H+ antiporter complex subunit F [Sphingomonas sp. S1-29]
MSGDWTFDLATVATGLSALLCIALAAAGWRMVKGPSFADRFVALDMLTAIAVTFAALTSVVTGRGVFLDIALGLSLINFVATAAFAVFLERKSRPR